MKRYSKAIASAVAAIVGFLVIQIPSIDGPMLEGGILMLLQVAGVYGAPANG